MRALIWDHLRCDETQVAALARETGMSPIAARVLWLRGITDPPAAERFLRPSLDHLHDPFLLTDVGRASERLLAAIERRERVAVHGDYDVDGVTSTVMLRRALELLGGDVVHFIPNRLSDGYGLQPEAIERLHAQRVRVIVSVDCGIRSAPAARRAAELGIDLIVTDHHEPDVTLPPAFAVINPKRQDCAYPDKDLAGVGVALKLVHALCVKRGRQRWLPAFVKIAALGTLADVVPLRGENRVIARLGLDELSRGRHTIGLRALLETSGLAGRRIGSFEVAFMLAPRINAAGRMSTPDLATRLLLASDEALADEARSLAAQLDTENAKRQQEEADILEAARRRIERDPDIGAHNILVVWGDGWHRGVIGLVASKLVETFNRPAIVLTIEGDVAHGSGRSIPAFDLLAALQQCAPLFVRFGGHRQAAGLTLDAARLKEFQMRIIEHADRVLSPDDLIPRLPIDGLLPLGAITGRVIEDLSALEPFGSGNRRPVFHARDVEIADGPRILKDRHLRFSIRHQGRTFPAVMWRGADRSTFFEEHRRGLNVAFSLAENHYQGERFVELSVADAAEAR